MITTKTGTYFESKVRRDGVMENGQQAKLNELYAVSAESFTECEAKVTEHVGQYTQGELEVLTEARAKYHEVFLSDKCGEDAFYKVQVAFITLDEVSGKEKKTKASYLVQGDSVEAAKKNVDEVMSQTMVDYKIVSVGECAVIDVVE